MTCQYTTCHHCLKCRASLVVDGMDSAVTRFSARQAPRQRDTILNSIETRMTKSHFAYLSDRCGSDISHRLCSCLYPPYRIERRKQSRYNNLRQLHQPGKFLVSHDLMMIPRRCAVVAGVSAVLPYTPAVGNM